MDIPDVAFDVSVLPGGTANPERTGGGWLFGLPPGLSAGQWPLSTCYGYPLRHAFTVRVPPAYRTRGASFVALSLFVDLYFEEDGADTSGAVQEFFESALSDVPPHDTALLPFWKHRCEQHPSQHRMEDDQGTEYVAIWLTEDEMLSPLCSPPDLAGNPLLDATLPGWLRRGSALDQWDRTYSPHLDLTAHDYALYRMFGEVPQPGPVAYQVSLSPRDGDPNTGKPVSEGGGPYIPMYSPEGQALGLERFACRNHFGGTMAPMQGHPDFSPFYIEFEEAFGGFNFGGGNAQLDLKAMRLEWAC